MSISEQDSTDDTVDYEAITDSLVHMNIFISRAELGDFNIQVARTAKPLWHGAYQTGKLTMYLADIIGATLKPINPIVFHVSDIYYPDFNLVGWYAADANTSDNDQIMQVLTYVNEAYVGYMNEYKIGNVSDGTIKLQ